MSPDDDDDDDGTTVGRPNQNANSFILTTDEWITQDKSRVKQPIKMLKYLYLL